MNHLLAVGALLTALLAQGAEAGESDHAGHRADTTDYALILPTNLPHMLRTSLQKADQLGLDEAQRKVLRELMAAAPNTVFSRLAQAEKLEQSIAGDVLHQRPQAEALPARLDELAALKRAATEAQIATIGRMQSVLTHEQFRQLLRLSGVRQHQ